jgi:hypothetical protein
LEKSYNRGILDYNDGAKIDRVIGGLKFF